MKTKKLIKQEKRNWYAPKQRFSIRKYHFGAASVLLGLTFILLCPCEVSALQDDSGSKANDVVSLIETEKSDSAEVNQFDAEEIISQNIGTEIENSFFEEKQLSDIEMNKSDEVGLNGGLKETDSEFPVSEEISTEISSVEENSTSQQTDERTSIIDYSVEYIDESGKVIFYEKKSLSVITTEPIGISMVTENAVLPEGYDLERTEERSKTVSIVEGENTKVVFKVVKQIITNEAVSNEPSIDEESPVKSSISANRLDNEKANASSYSNEDDPVLIKDEPDSTPAATVIEHNRTVTNPTPVEDAKVVLKQVASEAAVLATEGERLVATTENNNVALQTTTTDVRSVATQSAEVLADSLATFEQVSSQIDAVRARVEALAVELRKISPDGEIEFALAAANGIADGSTDEKTDGTDATVYTGSEHFKNYDNADLSKIKKQITWLDFSDKSWSGLDYVGTSPALKVGATYKKEIAPGYVVEITVSELKPFESTDVYRDRVKGTDKEWTYNPNAVNSNMKTYVNGKTDYGNSARIIAAAQDEFSNAKVQGFDVPGLVTLRSIENFGNVGVKFTTKATYLGNVVPLNVVFMSGEEARNSEFETYTTNGEVFELFGETSNSNTVSSYKVLDNWLEYNGQDHSGNSADWKAMFDGRYWANIATEDSLKTAKQSAFYRDGQPTKVVDGIGTKVFGPVSNHLKSGFSTPIVLTKNASEVGMYIMSTGRQSAMIGVALLDYGDAPDSYGTGAHSINFNEADKQPYLGTKPADIDFIPEGIPVGAANWYRDELINQFDEGSAQLMGDRVEEGYNYTLHHANDNTYSLNIVANSNGNGKAYVQGWIDFNNDGKFDETENSGLLQIVDGKTNYTLTFSDAYQNVDTSVTKLGVRLRIALDAADIITPDLTAYSGEVEDFQIQVTHPPRGEKLETTNNQGVTQTGTVEFHAYGENRYSNTQASIDTTVPAQIVKPDGTLVTASDLDANGYYVIAGEGKYKITDNGQNVNVEFVPEAGFITQYEDGTIVAKAQGISIRRSSTVLDGSSTAYTTGWHAKTEQNKLVNVSENVTVNGLVGTMDGRYIPHVIAVKPTGKNATSTAVQGATQTGTPTFTSGVTSGSNPIPMGYEVDASGNPITDTTEPKYPLKLVNASGVEVDSTDATAMINGVSTVVGTYTINNRTGEVTFTPNETGKKYIGGVDAATVIARDVNGASAMATYTPTITPVAPTAEAATSVGLQGKVQTGKPAFEKAATAPNGVAELDNATLTLLDANGNKTKEFSVDGQGTYKLNDDGTIKFTPLPEFVGSATPVHVQIADTNGTIVSTTYTPVVVEVKPTGKPDETFGLKGEPQTSTPDFFEPGMVDLDGDKAYDIDSEVVVLDQNTLTLLDNQGLPTKEVTLDGQGTYQLNDNGSITFTPLPTFVGKATPVTVQIKDINGTPATTTYTPTVIEVPETELKESVTRTIKYVYAGSGAEASSPVTETLKFTRTATINAETGEITYSDWSDAQEFPLVTSPVIKGYIADTKEVPAKTVNAEDADISEEVVYTPLGSWIPMLPNGDKPKTQYPNDPTDATKPGEPIKTVPGTSTPVIPYVPGYSPKAPNGSPLTPVDSNDLSKGYIPPVPEDPTKDTVVTYAPNEQKATVKYVLASDESNDLTTRDVLTGGSEQLISYSTADKIQALVNKGYKLVNDGYPTGAKFDADDKVDQEFIVTFVERTEDVPPTDPKTPGTPVDPNNPDGPKWPDGLEKSDLNESVTRTVKYIFEDGSVASETKTQTVTFTRTAKVNLVTSEVTYSQWTPESQTLVGYALPKLDGYIAIRATDDGLPVDPVATESDLSVTEESKDLTQVVVYAKLGSWIPNLPAGETPVPPTVYPNDPTDPTKPGTEVPTIPYVPGYTPEDPSGNPLKPVDPNDPTKGYVAPPVPNDPTKDTPINYVKDEQKATFEYVNVTDPANPVVLKTDNVTGKTGDAIGYDPEATIVAYEKAGYTVEEIAKYDPAQVYTADSSDVEKFVYKLIERVEPVDPTDPNTPTPEPDKPVDPNDPNSPVWPATVEDLKTTETVTRTIKYVYADGTTAAKTVTETLNYTRTAQVNLGTGKITYGEWTSTDSTFDKVTSPLIPNYTADKLVVAEETGVLATAQDEEVTVIYRENDKQLATITYKTDAGTELAKDGVQGHPGDAINYSTADRIAAYKALGYELVSDGFTTATDKTYDSDTASVQNFDVILKAKVTTIDPENPSGPNPPKPGEPVDPSDPNSPVLKDLVETVTRKVVFQYEDGSEFAPSATNTVTFTRVATYNHVTKTVTYSDWVAKDSDDVLEGTSLASKEGYTVKSATSNGLGILPTTVETNVKVAFNTEDINEVVVYTPQKQQAVVKFVDVTDPTDPTTLHTEDLAGKTGDSFGYDPVTKLAELEKSGYTVTKRPAYDPTGTYSTDPSDVEEFVYEVVETVVPVDPTDPNTPTPKPGEPVDPTDPNSPIWPDSVKDLVTTEEVTRTISYVDTTGKTVFATKTESKTFTRTAKINLVTGEITYGEWSAAQSLAEVTSPELANYLVSIPVVGAQDVAYDDADINIQVVYTPLGSWVPVVPPGYPDVPETVYPVDPTDPTKPGTEVPTVPYIPGLVPVGPDGETPLKPVDPNDPTKGYEVPPVPENPTQDTPITYVLADQKAFVNYVDESGKSLATSGDLTGKSGDAIDYSTTPTIEDLLKKGYELVSNDYPEGATYDKDATVDQVYTVVLKEKVVPVDPTDPNTPTPKPGEPVDPTDPNSPVWPDSVKDLVTTEEVTRTISYVDNTGKTVFASVTETKKFTRTAEINLVTGEITYGEWTAVQTFDDVTSPSLANHLVDTPVVTGQNVNPTDEDINVTVVYTPLGSWVPVVPPGFPDVPSTVYPVDPEDPTKPGTDVPTVPYIPGTTPVTPDPENPGKSIPLTPVDPEEPSKGYVVPPVPTDPTKDTPIIYVEDNKQLATVSIVDESTGNTITTFFEQGKPGMTVGIDTAAKLAELAKAGYDVTSDEYNDSTKVYDKDDNVDQSWVIKVTQRVVPVDPTDPNTPTPKPGEPVDPTDPNSPVWPDSVKDLVTTQEVVRTITYVNEAGETVSTEVVQKVSFTRTAKVNLVTGAITYGEWTPAQELPSQTSPVVKGYYTETPLVDTVTVNAEDADINVPVVYKKLGNWVPNIPGQPVTPLPYPNDPEDPTVPGTDVPVIPYVPGYTPEDPNGNPLKPVDPEDPSKGYIPPTPENPGVDTPINYVADDQKATVNYVDENGKQLATSGTLTGKSGGAIDYTTTPTIEDLIKQGYELVKDGFPTGASYDKDKSVDQVFTVTLKEKVVPVDPTDPNTPTPKPGEPVDPTDPNSPVWPDSVKDLVATQEVVRTITYVDEAGNTVATEVVQKVSFTRTAKVNLVTGEITYGEWTSAQELSAQASPVVKGYYTETPLVDTVTVNAEDADINLPVVYKKLGNWVPNIPGQPVNPLPYPNDPEDPTVPGTDVPAIPYVPGYTPEDPNGNPLKPVDPEEPSKGYIPPTPENPGVDTPINYVPNKVTLVVNYVDENGNPLVPSESTPATVGD
ncbi:YSIRK-type signal peptide-containing protein, partial [Streptococcus suis]|nr:YSIRK-type signal peptide-containing protein [Streptococcus suis]